MPSATARAACAICCAISGHESEIYALTVDDDLRDDIRPFADPAARTGDVTDLSLRAAVADDRRVRTAAARARASVSQHHAGAFLRALRCQSIFRLLALGRQELETLVGQTDLAMGDSEYNRRELAGAGVYQHGRFSHRRRSRPYPPRAPAAGAREGAFGWVAQFPLRRAHRARTRRSRTTSSSPSTTSAMLILEYRFIFVGKTDGVPRYYNMIRALVAEYQMPADRFWFTGAVPEDDLATFYRLASAYVSFPSMRGSVCPYSKRWRPTSRCSPMAPRRTRRSVGARPVLTPRISSQQDKARQQQFEQTMACMYAFIRRLVPLDCPFTRNRNLNHTAGR